MNRRGFLKAIGLGAAALEAWQAPVERSLSGQDYPGRKG